MLEKVAKFGSVCFNIKNVINVQSCRGQNPPPGLIRVNDSSALAVRGDLVIAAYLF